MPTDTHLPTSLSSPLSGPEAGCPPGPRSDTSGLGAFALATGAPSRVFTRSPPSIHSPRMASSTTATPAPTAPTTSQCFLDGLAAGRDFRDRRDRLVATAVGLSPRGATVSAARGPGT